MKLSEKTLELLKTFTNNNQNFMFLKGKTQKTICGDMTVLAEARIDEDIPVNFGIYDLGQFLANISILNNPELEFTGENITMKASDGWTLTYLPCSPSTIQIPPEDSIELLNPDVTFDLEQNTLNRIMKISQINAWPYLSVVGKNNELSVVNHKEQKDIFNDPFLAKKFDTYAGKDFTATFKLDNFKIVSDDYTVEIVQDGLSKFTAKNNKITYYIALDAIKDS